MIKDAAMLGEAWINECLRICEGMSEEIHRSTLLSNKFFFITTFHGFPFLVMVCGRVT